MIGNAHRRESEDFCFQIHCALLASQSDNPSVALPRHLRFCARRPDSQVKTINAPDLAPVLRSSNFGAMLRRVRRITAALVG